MINFKSYMHTLDISKQFLKKKKKKLYIFENLVQAEIGHI